MTDGFIHFEVSGGLAALPRGCRRHVLVVPFFRWVIGDLSGAWGLIGQCAGHSLGGVGRHHEVLGGLLAAHHSFRRILLAGALDPGEVQVGSDLGANRPGAKNGFKNAFDAAVQRILQLLGNPELFGGVAEIIVLATLI